ncbi:MAG: protein translocase subunit SecF [Methanosarcinales archaeon]|jgi:preprotein translocase subunit SecF|nr:protein translocase subunit SecF [Methanosarcinales archaeon]
MNMEIYQYVNPFVQKTSNKKLIAIALVDLALALMFIIFTMMQTGAPVALGMNFVGGTQFTMMTDMTEEELQDMFSDYPLTTVRIFGSYCTLQFNQMDGDDLKSLEDTIYGNASFQEVQEDQISPRYSKDLQRSSLIAVMLSFVGMMAIVFLLFRKVVPALAIILSSASDIIIAMAFMDLFGIELTLGTIAALLMIIGYSVDSNILLTNKVFKGSGTLDNKISAAMRTGLIMTTTTAVAFFIMHIITTYMHYILPEIAPVPIISQLSLIVLIGLLADTMNTWFLNVGILRMYLTHPKNKSKKGGRHT